MKQHKELYSFYQGIPGGMLIYYATGKEEIIYANDELIHLFGCDSFEDFKNWTQNSFQGLVHPEDLEKVEASIWEQIDKNDRKLDHVVYRIIRKDKKIRYVEDFGRLVHDELHGDIFYVFITDITTSVQEKEKIEHKTLEQAREKAILRAALESTVYSYREIYIVNLEENSYRLIYPLMQEEQEQGIYTEAVYKHIEKKKIYENNEAWISEVLHPRNIQKELLEKNNVEYQYRRTYKGSVEWCITSFTVFERRGTLPISVIMGIRSIDEILKKEIQQKEILQSALDQAKKASVAKTTFLSNMSHDIRTPMNAILGYTEIANQNLENKDKVAECLEKIHQASCHLLGIMNDVLNFSKIEAGRVGLTMEAGNICDIALEIYNDHMPFIKEKNIQFILDTSSIFHPNILCDVTKLNQILSNVVNNAIKYTEENGKVSFTITEKKTYDKKISEYIFTIEDTGMGMNPEFISKAFEPFEREKNTTISKISGTGLGLAITKNLVEIMKGTIDVTSQVGVGTKFMIHLSFEHISSNEVSQDPATLEEQAIAFLKDKRVLVVEDNELNREIVRDILSIYGLVVDEVEDGSFAVTKVLSEPKYDFIIMDIQMPIMNGYEATKAIRALEDQDKRNTPIIAMSANAFYEDKQKSLQAGMNAHLAKPIDIHIVLKTIYEILKSNQN